MDESATEAVAEETGELTTARLRSVLAGAAANKERGDGLGVRLGGGAGLSVGGNVALSAITDGHHPAPTKGMRRAAVLILLDADRDPSVILTKRSADLREHAGQVSFPGGAIELGESEAEAALREAWEECAIDDAGVQVWGTFPASSLPVTSFSVTPVVGIWDSARALEPVANPGEVESIHLVKVADLADPANRGVWTRVSGGARHVGPAFEVDGLVVWGFTAMLLDGLLEVAGWTRPWDSERNIDVLPRSAT